MSVQTVQNQIDNNLLRIVKNSSIQQQMIRKMHRALQQIATCEISREGSLAQKRLAEIALIEIHGDALEMEVSNA